MICILLNPVYAGITIVNKKANTLLNRNIFINSYILSHNYII